MCATHQCTACVHWHMYMGAFTTAHRRHEQLDHAADELPLVLWLQVRKRHFPLHQLHQPLCQRASLLLA